MGDNTPPQVFWAHLASSHRALCFVASRREGEGAPVVKAVFGVETRV